MALNFNELVSVMDVAAKEHIGSHTLLIPRLHSRHEKTALSLQDVCKRYRSKRISELEAKAQFEIVKKEYRDDLNSIKFLNTSVTEEILVSVLKSIEGSIDKEIGFYLIGKNELGIDLEFM